MLADSDFCPNQNEPWNYQKDQIINELDAIVFLGQYSAVWLSLSLIRVGIKMPSTTILCVPKHFTGGPCKTASWGQMPGSMPLVVQGILSEIDPTISMDEYLTWEVVFKAREMAIDKLREFGIIVYEVETIENINMSEHGKLCIEGTIDRNDPRQTKHSSEPVSEDFQNNKIRLHLPIEVGKKITIINTLTKPKKHDLKDLNNFVEISQLFKCQQEKYSIPKIVIGTGLSAMSVKEIFEKDEIIFVGKRERLENCAKIPRYKETVGKIDVVKLIVISGNFT